MRPVIARLLPPLLAVGALHPTSAFAKDTCDRLGKAEVDGFTGKSTATYTMGRRPFLVTQRVSPWSWSLHATDGAVTLGTTMWLAGDLDVAVPVGWTMQVLLTDGKVLTLATKEPTATTTFVYDGHVVLSLFEPRFALDAASFNALGDAGPKAVRFTLTSGEVTGDIEDKALAGKVTEAVACVRAKGAGPTR